MKSYSMGFDVSAQVLCDVRWLLEAAGELHLGRLVRHLTPPDSERLHCRHPLACRGENSMTRAHTCSQIFKTDLRQVFVRQFCSVHIPEMALTKTKVTILEFLATKSPLEKCV